MSRALRGASQCLQDASGQQSWGCRKHGTVTAVPVRVHGRPQRRCWPTQTAGQRHRSVTAKQCVPLRCGACAPRVDGMVVSGPHPVFFGSDTPRSLAQKGLSSLDAPDGRSALRRRTAAKPGRLRKGLLLGQTDRCPSVSVQGHGRLHWAAVNIAQHLLLHSFISCVSTGAFNENRHLF